jgi:hypothetical protein
MDRASYPFLEPGFAFEQLKNPSIRSLPEFLNNVMILAKQAPRLVAPLVKLPDFPEVMVSALNAGHSEDITIALFRAFIILFPLFPENQEAYIDNGLCMLFIDWLSGEGGSLTVTEGVIALIDCISESSGYGRDSILCLGIHTALIDLALRQISEPITVAACEALNKVFANKHHIDPTTLSDCVEPMSQLLRLQWPQAVFVALSCFVAMTNKMPALVFAMYDLGLFPEIVAMLENEHLVGMALPLIGNLSVGHAAHITTLLQCHLFQILMALIKTEYTADVFWVLSNLVESVPYLTIGLFDPNFIRATVEISDCSGYSVKKEAAFFLATLILFTETDDLRFFISESILNLMSEMLECSIGLIILRCLDALLRFARAVELCGVTDSLLEMLHGSDLRASLSRLLEQKNFMIRERAEILLERLSEVSPLCE